MSAFKVSKISKILADAVAAFPEKENADVIRQIAYDVVEAFRDADSRFNGTEFLRECILPESSNGYIEFEMNKEGKIRRVVRKSGLSQKAENEISAAFPVAKKRGRPLGSKNKPKVQWEDGPVTKAVKNGAVVKLDAAVVSNFAETYAERLTEKFAGKKNSPVFSVETGYKFEKIVKDATKNAVVHCFVEKTTGDVIKAASYKAPARRSDRSLAVMGNIAGKVNMNRMVKKADEFGAYLYSNKI